MPTYLAEELLVLVNLEEAGVEASEPSNLGATHSRVVFPGTVVSSEIKTRDVARDGGRGGCRRSKRLELEHHLGGNEVRWENERMRDKELKSATRHVC